MTKAAVAVFAADRAASRSLLPSGLQAKLLRAIETKEVLPVGANRPVTVSARVLAATNKDLAAEITREWYNRYRAERDAIDKDHAQLDLEDEAEAAGYRGPSH